MTITKPDIITVRSRSGAGHTHALDRRYSANERALCGIRVTTRPVAHGEVTCRRCRDLKNAPGTPPPAHKNTAQGRARQVPTMRSAGDRHPRCRTARPLRRDPRSHHHPPRVHLRLA